ncbi:ABC transporter permease [Actinoplanes sp. SE50]|uniref:branched-chain amino acid ABC transporter permease n=1 Tax=unclassified Actinoplanes TaxID=2626549 RepID=UPI00023EC5E3|nr:MULTISPECIES: branched-chain amino acid ABC transporter permease [unclassified Actinoplanes]AEV83645.1 Autoinducer 2 import system permease protein lsrC [Actinoplanes sp. SE50/110]ATO82211.1 ABC transporter permease [Actinoplanes sp. SE50]SLL99618.1 ABC transporter permease [Actinoplanes sp. SE50/110]
MSTVVLLTLTGLGLAALYFLIASGLSLVFGLAGVLNFAHGLFLSAGAYATWWAAPHWGLPAAVVFGIAVAAATGALVELLMIRPLYTRHTEQVLVTAGLSLAGVALLQSVWGADARVFPRPAWAAHVTGVLGATVPNDRFLLIGAAVLVVIALTMFLRYTRYGLIIRAGVENRAMVRALGIDVRIAFTLVFAIGGALAGLAGILGGMYFTAVSPGQGASLLIFAFIVVVIGGLGSINGSAVAAVGVGLLQQFVNYYGAAGAGDVSVVALLAIVLLIRPAGIAGTAVAA